MGVGSESTLRTETIIVQHRAPAGVVAGALGCIFGILGIFFIGLIFVPLAALCAITGLVRGIGSGSFTAIGLSIIAGMLSIFGFMVSPSLWALVGAGLLVGLLASNHATPSASPSHSYLSMSPPPAYIAPRPSFEEIFIPQASKLIGAVEQFNDMADRYAAGLNSAEAKYQSITAKMNSYLERERDLVDDSNYAARGQLVVIINQGFIATDQIHDQVQNAASQLQDKAAPLSRSVAMFDQTCHRASNPDFKPGPFKTTCLDLLRVSDKYMSKIQSLRDGFTQAEQTYQRERAAQDNLVTESERAQ